MLEKAEAAFLFGSGVSAGAMRHLGAADRERFTIEAISTEALTTSEIEGELLDSASVQSSLRRELGLATDGERAGRAERGVATMMADLFRSFSAPLTRDMLCGWHGTLLAGRRDMADVGRYRTGGDPMQVVSGPMHAPRVHFEAPPAAARPAMMAQYVDWFNRTGPDGGEPLPALTRAGLSHLYFEVIHPFADGNGRIGRAISEKALARCLGRPTLVALAATILRRRKAYYRAFETVNKSNEITPWLKSFAEIAVEAQRRTTARIEFLIDKTKLLDGLRGRLNARQEKAPLRVLREGPEGFVGGLSAGNYMTITGTTPATARRDLADLVSKRALTRTGERRYTRYHLAIPLRSVRAVTIDATGEVR